MQVLYHDVIRARSFTDTVAAWFPGHAMPQAGSRLGEYHRCCPCEGLPHVLTTLACWSFVARRYDVPRGNRHGACGEADGCLARHVANSETSDSKIATQRWPTHMFPAQQCLAGPLGSSLADLRSISGFLLVAHGPQKTSLVTAAAWLLLFPNPSVVDNRSSRGMGQLLGEAVLADGQQVSHRAGSPGSISRYNPKLLG